MLGVFFLCVIIVRGPAQALDFPDTLALKKTFSVKERKNGYPVRLTRGTGKDFLSLTLTWDTLSKGKIFVISARYSQNIEFQSDFFSTLTSEYAKGATWHALPDPAPSESELLKAYPGLKQQWLLSGFEADKGWLGSGVLNKEYFLVFQAEPPSNHPRVAEDVRLDAGLQKRLDTLKGWIKIPCTGDEKTVCYSPADNPRLRLRFDAGGIVHVWLKEKESLSEVKNHIQNLSAMAHREYARDLSEILFMEARMFLASIGQAIPGLFNWPSWQLQSFNSGKVPADTYFLILQNHDPARYFLPILDYENPGVRMGINLSYDGDFHLTAKPKPGKK